MMMMMTMKTFALACAVLLLARGAHAQPGQDDPCLTEGEALDACMTTAGLGDAAQGVCDTCVDLAASATYTIGTITCDELASGDNGLCTALNLCPCPAECAAEAGSYALCEINAELGLGCESIDCPPPQGTDAPPAVTDVPPEGTDPTAPPSVEGVDACLTEDEALDACMIREGTGDADKEECDICVGAAAAATYAIMTTSCDELAMTDNGLCVALGLCRTCPVGCSTEMNAYALCEVNDELGLGCETLECNVADGAATDTPLKVPILLLPVILRLQRRLRLQRKLPVLLPRRLQRKLQSHLPRHHLRTLPLPWLLQPPLPRLEFLLLDSSPSLLLLFKRSFIFVCTCL